MDSSLMPGPDVTTASDVHRELVLEDQVLLILVGLPGSGKTTFSEALLKHHHVSIDSSALGPGASLSPRLWIRASQDDAPSRRRQEVEALVRRGLEEGCNVVVDRVGFDRTQRSHFVAIARARPIPPRICCLFMSASPMTLETRLLAREYHPTIKDPETAIRVLGEMTRQLSPPRPGDGEGFDRIAEIREDEQPAGGVWLQEDIQRVLRKVARGGGDEGQYVPAQVAQGLPHRPGRGVGYGPRGGRGGRGGRGRGQGYAHTGQHHRAYAGDQGYPTSAIPHPYSYQSRPGYPPHPHTSPQYTRDPQHLSHSYRPHYPGQALAQPHIPGPAHTYLPPGDAIGAARPSSDTANQHSA